MRRREKKKSIIQFFMLVVCIGGSTKALKFCAEKSDAGLKENSKVHNFGYHPYRSFPRNPSYNDNRNNHPKIKKYKEPKFDPETEWENPKPIFPEPERNNPERPTSTNRPQAQPPKGKKKSQIIRKSESKRKNSKN